MNSVLGIIKSKSFGFIWKQSAKSVFLSVCDFAVSTCPFFIEHFWSSNTFFIFFLAKIDSISNLPFSWFLCTFWRFLQKGWWPFWMVRINRRICKKTNWPVCKSNRAHNAQQISSNYSLAQLCLTLVCWYVTDWHMFLVFEVFFALNKSMAYGHNNMMSNGVRSAVTNPKATNFW